MARTAILLWVIAPPPPTIYTPEKAAVGVVESPDLCSLTGPDEYTTGGALANASADIDICPRSVGHFPPPRLILVLGVRDTCLKYCLEDVTARRVSFCC